MTTLSPSSRAMALAFLQLPARFAVRPRKLARLAGDEQGATLLRSALRRVRERVEDEAARPGRPARGLIQYCLIAMTSRQPQFRAADDATAPRVGREQVVALVVEPGHPLRLVGADEFRARLAGQLEEVPEVAIADIGRLSRRLEPLERVLAHGL